MIKIRIEKPEDENQVRLINEQAFETSIEADLVDALRSNCANNLSIVAEEGSRLVGHILFSPAFIENSIDAIEGMGLAPMSVLPDHQRQGIGSALVQEGLDILRQLNCSFVIVLGHPQFYPRFGFKPASQFNLSCQWVGVPDEAFMVIIMDEYKMKGTTGIASYRDEFNAAM